MGAQMIQVSIIIPCFNGKRFLPDLVNCLKECVTDSVEVIFVDDGSTDGSGNSFIDYYPNATLIKKQNQGLAAARNSGATVAVGDFLQFLDVDDYIEAHKIKAQYSFAKFTGAEIVYSDWQMVTVTENIKNYEPVFNSKMEKEPVEELLMGWWNPPHSYLIKKSAYFDVGGSDEKLVNAQDFDLILRLAINKKKFRYLEGNFSKYYRYSGILSLARGSRFQYWKDYQTAVTKNYEFMQENHILTDKIKFAFAHRLLEVARNIYKIDRKWAKTTFLLSKTMHKSNVKNQKKVYKLLLSLFGFTQAEMFVLLYHNFINYLMSINLRIDLKKNYRK